MCYDIKTKLETQLKRAKHYNNQRWIEELENKLKPYLDKDINHASGFMHPTVLIYTSEKPFEPQPYQWGLVPSWVKDDNQKNLIWNKTINARRETMFEKPSFKAAAKSKHCIVYVDGFFEHHHYKGKTYPFYIYRSDNQPMALAGLYDQWVNRQTGEVFNTFTIVTTRANELMSKIHNSPKLAEPRMPVILKDDACEDWLSNKDENIANKVLLPFSDEKLKAHTVAPLRGKLALGDVPEASEPFAYEELKWAI
ncbi:SOS response-associated peptidase [Carboxylicivirga caseinilyticus]|uniref:SOS response-associated peptidase n=1 Tax=Carboxylicivirga caseinilyticus TaxID=3417572 RepID=UPI003D33FA7E|nr:SOS response-associated peptidase [Marinilabiliaceae bacterium A049]